ncbi:MAG: Ca2+/Na+ antiporter, partial [Frankiales bacterium]|nr:Ca2+/Na+ antiporter [Frankiales bacterium]
MTLAVVLLLLAAGLLVAGAEMFVENAAAAAGRLGVTVLAVAVLLAGAEPEELLTAVLASAQDRPGLAVGDAVGANVTMLTAALGLAAVVRPLPVGPRVRLYAVGSAIAGVLAVLALLDGRIGRVEGGLLLLAYVGLVAYVWRREKAPPQIGELAEMDDADPERAPVLALLLVGVGLGLMTVGGAAAVEGATR